jgi:hypothetical protein
VHEATEPFVTAREQSGFPVAVFRWERELEMYSELGEWEVDWYVLSILLHHQVLRILCLLLIPIFTLFRQYDISHLPAPFPTP